MNQNDIQRPTLDGVMHTLTRDAELGRDRARRDADKGWIRLDGRVVGRMRRKLVDHADIIQAQAEKRHPKGDPAAISACFANCPHSLREPFSAAPYRCARK